ncbi:MAG: recombination mediator RecR [Pseudomonadota bacterium]|nr:recombination mediator RecR [Pseudomonadota bacterium]
MAGKDIEKLVKLVAKLPALGTRSSRRIVLQLLKKRESLFLPLIDAMQQVAANVKTCDICGNYDTESPCSICSSQSREDGVVCVVQDVADLWAMERVSMFKGKYHVLGGILSALDGISAEDLNIDKLFNRIEKENIKEIILALPATIDGQITTNYLLQQLKNYDIKVTTLAQGIPMGAELDYMDEGTIQLALNSRKVL